MPIHRVGKVHSVSCLRDLELCCKGFIVSLDDVLEGVDGPARVEVDPYVGLAMHHVHQDNHPGNQGVKMACLVRGHLRTPAQAPMGVRSRAE